MRNAHAMVLLAAVLGAAGCQSDLQMRQLNRQGTYATTMWETEGLALESYSRRVIVDFTRPPIGDIVDSDTFIGYVSIPIYPKRGFVFTEPKFGVGWSDVAMSFGGIFDPFPDKLPYGKRINIREEDLPEGLGDLSTGIGGNWSPVDPRYQEYAAELRDHLFRIDFAGAEAEHERTAEAPVIPPAAAGAPVLREND